MQAKTKSAMNAMMAEAQRIKAERQGDPESMTVREFSEASSMPRPSAYKHLEQLVLLGKATRSTKRCKRSVVPSYRML